MVEYALILVLVSIVVIVILLTMGGQIQNVFSNVVAALGVSSIFYQRAGPCPARLRGCENPQTPAIARPPNAAFESLYRRLTEVSPPTR